ncbi:MAG TPA: D-alanyl-D-alanine carboxypeptidase/D-alanyl-D-alanine-endopeptidase [Chitinophagaceae bacterium]
MKTINLLILLLCSFAVGAQNVPALLAEAFSSFEKDGQMVNGIASLYVVEAKSGKVVFEKNGRVGLAPASTQKVITSVTAYELLGKDFRYKTEVGYTGTLDNGVLNGSLLIRPSGDPTLGSWRWESTKEGGVMQRVAGAIRKSGIRAYEQIAVDVNGWDSEAIPDGWIWQDIGNYYGAGAGALNWRENQYDVVLQSGNTIDSKVEIKATRPQLYHYSLTSALSAAAKGTGDNAYIYFSPAGTGGVIRGTIPVGEKNFEISGAMPSAQLQFAATLADTLQRLNINSPSGSVAKKQMGGIERGSHYKVIHTEISPSLDSIIYWFNKKSINLYGEALLKTFAHKEKQNGDTGEGVKRLKNFWKGKGVAETELNMVDGSGLSPLNRVTTRAQVSILKYAKGQPWFRGFYNALPEYNGMKMKSGTINNVKGFAGYHTAKDGTEYVFSFLVNNYNGSSSALVQKMYRVLDKLK